MKNKIKKIISLFAAVLIFYPAFAQIGIGTMDPQGALDINAKANRKDTMGLVLPGVDKVELDTLNGIAYPSVTTPKSKYITVTVSDPDDPDNIEYYYVPDPTQEGAEAPAGTIVYDIGQELIRVKRSSALGDWSDGLVDKTTVSEEIDYNLFGGQNFKIKKASAGYQFTVAIGGDDEYVYSCGSGRSYRTGKGNTGNSKWGVVIGKKAVDVSAGYRHALAVLEDGTAWVWGSNGNGRTGLGTTSGSTSTPRQILMPEGVKIVAVAAGYYNSFLVTDNGEVYACGSNSYGLNGNGLTSSYQLTPQKITFPDGVKIKKVSASISVAGALADNGDLYTWGRNSYGMTGQGTTSGNTLTPSKILNDVKDFDMGRASLAAKTDNKVYGWGITRGIGLGDSSTPITTPREVSITLDADEIVNAVAVLQCYDDNSYTNSIIVTNKSAYGAGDNTRGYSYYKLGIIDPTDGSTIDSFTSFTKIQNSTIFEGTNFIGASMGRYHTILITEHSNDLYNNLAYGAGRNSYQNLGTGASSIRIFSTIKK
ncbi:MAG: hypothetical protein LIO93_02100 [Bacteroidales bacterium]|nr:hypothetical protein [Bacteroidales bacterium]